MMSSKSDNVFEAVSLVVIAAVAVAVAGGFLRLIINNVSYIFLLPCLFGAVFYIYKHLEK